MFSWKIYNATYVSSTEIIKDFEFFVVSDRIYFDTGISPEVVINLHGRVVMPAFINSFDNLLATYIPYAGKSHPYYNWYMWDNEVKSSSLFKERMLLDKEDLYFLGSYKNIFSGVTFVVDAIPGFVFHDIIDKIEIDLLQDFGISHSPASYSLNWGRGIKEEFLYAKKKNLPYIIRVGEGFDSESRNSIKVLKELGVLDKNTVLIHGISLSDEDIEIIKSHRCGFVWCPEVNEYIFGKTAPIKKILENDIPVGLGTGSSMHGNRNLFSTIKLAKKYIDDPGVILKMLWDNPVSIFFLNEKKKLENRSYATFLVIDRISPKNFDFIWDIDMEDILFVLKKGIPLLGSGEFAIIFQKLNITYEEIYVKKKFRLVKKGFKDKLKEIFFKLGKEIQFPFLPVEI